MRYLNQIGRWCYHIAFAKVRWQIDYTVSVVWIRIGLGEAYLPYWIRFESLELKWEWPEEL